MAKRKTLEIPHNIQMKYEQALGLTDEVVLEVISEAVEDFINFSIPWPKIESVIKSDISSRAKVEIDKLFKSEFYHRAVSHLKRKRFFFPDKEELSQGELNTKLKKISKLASNLEKEIDELTEIGTSLLMRPKTTGWRSSLDQEQYGVTAFIVRQEETTDEDFCEYLSFRRNLDYYVRIDQVHSLFSEYIGRRSQLALDYSWYEDFVRRTIIALLTTDFDLSITVPTDTNIEYESQIIVLFNELLLEFKARSKEQDFWSDLNIDFSYRQHARLILKLRKEFDDTDFKNTLLWLEAYKGNNPF